jgi:hypothetical protein
MITIWIILINDRSFAYPDFDSSSAKKKLLKGSHVVYQMKVIDGKLA